MSIYFDAQDPFIIEMKEWMKQNPITKEELKQLGSLSGINFMLGKNHTEDSKKLMSEKKKNYVPWNKGKRNIYSKETLEKMRLKKQNYVPWNVGISPSEETRKKIARKGPRNHFYGKKRPDHAETMRLIWQKRKQKCLHQ